MLRDAEKHNRMTDGSVDGSGVYGQRNESVNNGHQAQHGQVYR